MSIASGQLLVAVVAATIAAACVAVWVRLGGKLMNLSSREQDGSPQVALLTAAGLFSALALWSVFAAARPVGVTRIPAFGTVIATMYHMLVDGSLASNLGTSIRRITIGFGAASLTGVAVGWVSGTFVLANRMILPTSTFVRYIPPTAFVTLLIVYLGIDEGYKYGVVFASVFFFIVQMTVDAVEDIDLRYFEMARLTGLSPTSVLVRLVVPATMPRVVDVIRINLSGAWTFLVAAEVVGADGGLGHLIATSQRFGRIEQLYVAICIFGIVGIASDGLLRVVGARAFRWQS